MSDQATQMIEHETPAFRALVSRLIRRAADKFLNEKITNNVLDSFKADMEKDTMADFKPGDTVRLNQADP